MEEVTLAPEVKAASTAADAAREAWRQQSIEVRCMGDENGGWGTDAEYRAACRVRDRLRAAYETAWAAFARAFNAWQGSDLLDPERAS